jgi:hypothetical protein
MKAIKIDIVKEEIECNNQYFKEKEMDYEPNFCVELNGALPIYPSKSIERTYKYCKVYNPETKQMINYYVNVNEYGLFNDLIGVTNSFLKNSIEEMLLWEKYKIRESIKSFSWFKRLFKLF